MAFRIPSSCASAVSTPRIMTSCRNTEKCRLCFESRDYPSDLLQNAAWRETLWLQQSSQLHLQLHIDAISAWKISWYTPLTRPRQRYQELSHVNIPATALACTQRPKSVYVDPRIEPPSVNALSGNQRTLWAAFRAVYAPAGETGLTLRERCGEHLQSVRKNTGGFLVAEYFTVTLPGTVNHTLL